MTPEQVDKLITFGQMALEQGWYDQAREYFEQALELDTTNQEALDGLARVDEILRRKASFEPTKPEAPVAKPAQPEKPPDFPKLCNDLRWLRSEMKELMKSRVKALQRSDLLKRLIQIFGGIALILLDVTADALIGDVFVTVSTGIGVNLVSAEISVVRAMSSIYRTRSKRVDRELDLV